MIMSDILQKQIEFTKCVGQLIEYAYNRGYALTIGDGYRDPRVFGELGKKLGYGRAKSCHKLRLAIDLNLFVDGEWISDGDHPAWIDLSNKWESLHPLARSGLRFDDANHFSFLHEGLT